MKYQLIVLFGPPGCGKGTQANILESKNGYIQLGMSKLLEEFVTDETDTSVNSSHLKNLNEVEHAIRIRESIKSGGLVSFDDVVSIMEKSFSKNLKKGKRMTLDGFPRTPNQAIWLSGLITKEKVKTLFIHFDLPLATVLDRIEHRWFVEGSNKIYSSKEEAIKECLDGKEPFRRELDLNTDIIVKRYNEQYADHNEDIQEGMVNNTFVDTIHINASFHIDEIKTIIETKLIY